MGVAPPTVAAGPPLVRPSQPPASPAPAGVRADV